MRFFPTSFSTSQLHSVKYSIAAMPKKKRVQCTSSTADAFSLDKAGSRREWQRDDLHVVLVNPQIPQNAGNVARTCAATNIALHLVKPLGFEIDDTKLKRAGLDYWHQVTCKIHDDWESFEQYLEQLEGQKKLYGFSKFGKVHYASPGLYNKESGSTWLMFGAETTGLPESAHEAPKKFGGAIVKIPMSNYLEVRSLNLSTSVGVGVFEAIRQLDGAILPEDADERQYTTSIVSFNTIVIDQNIWSVAEGKECLHTNAACDPRKGTDATVTPFKTDDCCEGLSCDLVKELNPKSVNNANYKCQPIPPSPPPQPVQPKSYTAYITSNLVKYIQICDVSDGNPGVWTCTDSTPDDVTSPYSMDVIGNKAYIANNADNSIKTCVVSGKTLSDCISTGGFNVPLEIMVIGSTAYVANNGNASVSVCDIDASGYLVECVTTENTGGSGIFVDGAKAYTTNFRTGAVSVCDVSGPNLIDCVRTTGFKGPKGISVENNKIFVVNQNNNTVSVCEINGSSLEDCTATPGFAYPVGLAVLDSKAYVAAYIGDSVSVCDVDGLSLTGCGAQPGFQYVTGVYVVPNP